MDVTGFFKRSGDDVQLLIAHSTQDELGDRIVDGLDGKLNKDVNIVAEERIASFAELVALMQRGIPFNVFLLLAHGDKLTNAAWLYDDKDLVGRELSVKLGELSAALEGHVDDKLCLFGVCYFGTDDLAEAICDTAGALACIAPKPDSKIFHSEIVEGYGSLLNRLQALSHMDVGHDLLHSDLVKSMPQHLVTRLSVESRA